MAFLKDVLHHNVVRLVIILLVKIILNKIFEILNFQKIVIKIVKFTWFNIL